MKLRKLSLSLSLLFSAQIALADVAFKFEDNISSAKPTEVVFIDDINNLSGGAKAIDEQSDGLLTRLLSLNEFEPKSGSTAHYQLIGDTKNVLVVGTLDEDGFTKPELQDLGGVIAAALSSTTKNVSANIHISGLVTEYDDASAYIASGYHMRHYSFDKYKTVKHNGVSEITLISESSELSSNKYHNDLRFVAEGVHLARDFASEPGKSIYPQSFADVVKEKFKGIDNVDIVVMNMRELRKNNMGALIGVGKGSIHDPRMVVIEYMGGDRDEAPIALAGKGITFDTGGISIKRNDGMWAMKSDLSGAAAVAGTLYAIAKRGEKVNVVGLLPLAENMPSQDAIRPGDVLETMKGTSIEIMSTDAEGRLILADAVYYAQVKYSPKLLLNIATLTGSAARALSDEYAALITRDFDFSAEIMAIAEKSGEHVWPLPLHPNHFEQIKSPIADIKNSGAGNPGASIGAAVIGTFVDEDLAWIHLDIAGVDWLNEDIDVAPKGAQGWGVRFMDQLIREHAGQY